jgi:hypothetical protein
MVGLWMLGLLTVERAVRRGLDPKRWSVAESLRVVRRVMCGRGSRRDARNLAALAEAMIDSYRRERPKATRHWPRQKTRQPPGQPKLRMATKHEIRKAQVFQREKIVA